MASLKEEFDNYMVACYGDVRYLPPPQRKEVEQAFLSGAVVAATSPFTSEQVFAEARRRLMEMGSLHVDRN